jgi:hypothetical protein
LLKKLKIKLKKKRRMEKNRGMNWKKGKTKYTNGAT